MTQPTAEVPTLTESDLIKLARIPVPENLRTSEELWSFWGEHGMIDAIRVSLEEAQGSVATGERDVTADFFEAQKSGDIIVLHGSRDVGGLFDYEYSIRVGGFRGIEASLQTFGEESGENLHRDYEETAMRTTQRGEPRVAALVLREGLAELAAALEFRKLQQGRMLEVEKLLLDRLPLGRILLGAAIETGVVPK